MRLQLPAVLLCVSVGVACGSFSSAVVHHSYAIARLAARVESPPQRLEHGKSLYLQGNRYLALGNFQYAEFSYRKSRCLLRHGNPEAQDVFAKSTIGLRCARMGELLKQKYGSQSPETVSVRDWLTLVYKQTPRMEDAEWLMQTVLLQFKERESISKP